MAEGWFTMVTSNDQLHTLTHADRGGAGKADMAEEGGGADNICRKWTRDVWRLSTPSAPSSPAAGTYLMSCFTRCRATGLEFRFSDKLKFSLRTDNHYSIAYRFVLNTSLASFVSFSTEATVKLFQPYEHISWIRLLLTPFIGYFQRSFWDTQ